MMLQKSAIVDLGVVRDKQIQRRERMFVANDLVLAARLNEVNLTCDV